MADIVTCVWYAGDSDEVKSHMTLSSMPSSMLDYTGEMAGIWQSRLDQLEDLLSRIDQ